jgi:hypothetical protein
MWSSFIPQVHDRNSLMHPSIVSHCSYVFVNKLTYCLIELEPFVSLLILELI